MNESPIHEFTTYLDSLPWEGGEHSNHEQAHDSFLRAATLGIDPNLAMAEVVSRIERAGGQLVERDLKRQLERAYDFVSGQKIQSGTSIPSGRPAPQFQPGLIERATEGVTIKNIAERLREVSPFPVTCLQSHEALNAIYKEGETILLFNCPFGPGTGYRVGNGGSGPEIPEDECNAGPEIPEDEGKGVYMLLNPVDGEIHYNPREHTYSRRSLEAITDFRYILLESDKVPEETWLKFLLSTCFKIVAITESGGKSVHAIVRVDAEDKAHFDEIRADFKRLLVPFGADQNAMSAVRLTRLPGGMRNGREQRLLYLNPRPGMSPILNLFDK